MPLPSPIAWGPSHTLRILDQTLLPAEERYLDLDSVAAVAEAICSLRVRGAPLIGIAAAMGLVQALRVETGGLDSREGSEPGRAEAVDAVGRAALTLAATRPTAVNLRWALDRMRQRVAATPGGAVALRAALVAEATAIWDEDRQMCAAIGALGATLLPENAVVCTVCNAGALATGGMGTALAPMYTAHDAGRAITVIVPETRPLLQGSRLTAWELARSGIHCTVITDSMIASRLRRGDVDCVIVGADRIAANGDVANKIGTYGLALAARAHGVPFYVAAPRSTIDLATPSGADIPIEERRGDEVAELGGRRTAPEGVAVWNPAFDITPADLITGIITDAGILRPDHIAQSQSPPRRPPISLPEPTPA